MILIALNSAKLMGQSSVKALRMGHLISEISRVRQIAMDTRHLPM